MWQNYPSSSTFRGFTENSRNQMIHNWVTSIKKLFSGMTALKVKLFFYLQKNCASFSRYLNFCALHETANLKICNVIMNIIAY